MKKNKSFRFRTDITPETEVILSGRHGQPLTISLDEDAKRFDGREGSRKAVLKIIRDLLEAEDKGDPFTDDVMTERLSSMGYDIARRTVSKYREMLGYPKRADRRVKVR